MYLIYTGITRSSTDILKTINVDNSLLLLEDVELLELGIDEIKSKEDLEQAVKGGEQAE